MEFDSLTVSLVGYASIIKDIQEKKTTSPLGEVVSVF